METTEIAAPSSRDSIKRSGPSPTSFDRISKGPFLNPLPAEGEAGCGGSETDIKITTATDKDDDVVDFSKPRQHPRADSGAQT